ncbi:Gfo/Idh/MocA family protein [Occultella aeris]|uniref:Putative oxidoreductase YcjS n=1 Tax=Occultella aeris TaxID=2761496 RepID=A0A7M4DRH1_9MICO|nr:Gfo/Idh/MocA family oxidoreductase [Occultella aeris]VZO40065.1 putative oxidoreductase YcjS [Occultella aeris]
MTIPLRLTFLGVTHPHAAAWADAARTDSRTTITTVHDADADAGRTFAARYDAAAVASVSDALRDVDAVVVDGRNDEAAGYAHAAIDAGLPVFVEKTGARTAADLAEVGARAREAGLVSQMGYFARYSDSVERTARTLAEGTLGEVYLARFHSAIPHRAWSTMAHWFADGTNVVTPFMEAGCHMVDVVRHLLGEPTDIRATRVRRPGTPSPGEDALAATMRIGDAVVTIDFTAHEADPWNTGWGGELFGDAATLRFHVTPARTALGTGTHVPEVISPVAPDDADAITACMAAENVELMRRGMAAFIDAVHGTAPSPVDIADGARTLAVIEAALAASELPGTNPAVHPTSASAVAR